MGESFHIRIAESSDSKSIAQVHTRSWQSAYRGILPDEWLDGLRWEERKIRWDAILSSSTRGNVFVAANAQHKIIGFASIGPSRDEDIEQHRTHELYAIYLTPENWGMGIGAALFLTVLKEVPESAKWLSLWVLEENLRGRKFYESLGFLLDGATKSAEIDGYHPEEVRYCLALPLQR
jgi:GNAT superfamily N-acetyltransferase